MAQIQSHDYLSAKIMIVDDDPTNIKLLTSVLASQGYKRLVTSTDPCEAVDLFKKHNPDILLLDLNMPRKSGFEIIADLNKLGYNYLPVLVLTAYSDQDIRLQALKLGAKDFLVKPIDPLEVQVRINNILRVKFLLDLIQEQNLQLEHKIEERTRKLRNEIVKRKEAEQETLFAVTHDALTELPNYFALLSELDHKIGLQNDNDQMALILLSLDRFNEINKTLGHQNGDLVLKIVANRIKSDLRNFSSVFELVELRRGDTVARYAGGKFAIIIRFLDSVASAKSISKRILNKLIEPIEIEGLSLEVPATIGISMYPAHGSDAHVLIRQAEIALQWARDHHFEITVFSNEIDTYSPRRLALMADLRQALQKDRLTIYYQPIINLHTSNVEAVEALIRWPVSADKVLMPDEFIPNAEQSGIIKSITEWVIDKAVEQITNLSPRLKVSINMSAHCIQDPKLPLYIKRVLKKHNFPSTALGLEITESAMMKNPVEALNTLNSLHALGIELSIDDFGTGYSSLAYLKRLPVDKLKIDRTFVRDIKVDENDKRIVQSTIDMSHNFGLNVVAEGAEDSETVGMLKELGSDLVQGNYFAEPMSISQLSQWLKQSRQFDANTGL